MMCEGTTNPLALRETTMFSGHGLDLLIFALTVMLALAKLMKSMM